MFDKVRLLVWICFLRDYTYAKALYEDFGANLLLLSREMLTSFSSGSFGKNPVFGRVVCSVTR